MLDFLSSWTHVYLQRIRQEQDAAFEESLLEDQRKEEERQRQEQEEREAAQHAAESELEASQLQDLREERVKILREEFAKEPDGEGTVKIGIQLPDGNRLNRMFFISDQLQRVYDFVEMNVHDKVGTHSSIELMTRA